MSKSVTAFVYNNCSRDARVLKEAKTLTDAGYSVKILAVLDKNTVPHQKIDGFEIYRLEKDPINVRISRVFLKTRQTEKG